MTQDQAIRLVFNELNDANKKFPPFNSPHEGYAVILEEMDELWDEIKNNKHPMSSTKQKHEAIQVAAMGIKFLMNCCKEHM